MMYRDLELEDSVFRLEPGDEAAFEAVWERVLSFQRDAGSVYGRYCNALQEARIPFLPVDAFKYEPIATFPPKRAERIFTSSGTSGMVRARHYILAPGLYERSITIHFRMVFGEGPVTLLAHLPHYSGFSASSSLIYMVEHLMKTQGDDFSAFFLEDRTPLHRAIESRAHGAGSFILFGAAFGLLDLIERESIGLPDDAIVIETGGMKTYRRDVSRAALHERLAEGFGLPVNRIWSEYGMCELMSQCYTRGGPIYFPPPWMRCYVVDPENPLELLPEGTPGALAVIDLANLYTVSALLTQDKAVRRGDGFEVLGRLKGAELRGCNFLLEDMRSA